ncbi:MAG: hypothetical protein HZA17_00045 [Nitrospirae bacterium]|nr:hypothetical protein [Nitrospirota bacterium]
MGLLLRNFFLAALELFDRMEHNDSNLKALEAMNSRQETPADELTAEELEGFRRWLEGDEQ